jgi:hypothetical protein
MKKSIEGIQPEFIELALLDVISGVDGMGDTFSAVGHALASEHGVVTGALLFQTFASIVNDNQHDPMRGLLGVAVLSFTLAWVARDYAERTHSPSN